MTIVEATTPIANVDMEESLAETNQGGRFTSIPFWGPTATAPCSECCRAAVQAQGLWNSESAPKACIREEEAAMKVSSEVVSQQAVVKEVKEEDAGGRYGSCFNLGMFALDEVYATKALWAYSEIAD